MQIGYKPTQKLMGFTLVELMVTMAIIGILITMATPVSFFQKTQSIDYSNVAMEHAKSYTNMINDNYAKYYLEAKNGTISIPYTTVAANGYNGALSITDKYGAVPCATLKYNSQTQKLTMFMYYVGGNGIQANIISGASNYLNGVAAQLVNGVYQGAFGSWSVPLSAIVGSCAKAGVPDLPSNNSLAVNLSLLTTQIGNISNDTSLHRTADTSGAKAGTLANSNTMQADIIMGYKPFPSASSVYSGIYFTENNAGPYLTTGANTRLMSPYNTGNVTDLVVANATLVANSFTPKITVVPGTLCTQAEVGKMLLDATIPGNTNSVATLMCTYDTLNCPTAPNYCYLPNSRLALTLNPGANVSSYTCPTGYFIDKSLPITLSSGPLPTTTCMLTEIGPRVATPAGTIITNGTNLIYSGVTASTRWVVQNTSAGCILGTVINAPAFVISASCINYPEMEDVVESNSPTPTPTISPLNYFVILASGKFVHVPNNPSTSYVKLTLFSNATKMLTLDNDGYLSCYDGNNNLLWQSNGGYPQSSNAVYNIVRNVSFQRPNGLGDASCNPTQMTFPDQAAENAYKENFMYFDGTLYFVFPATGANNVWYGPNCPANYKSVPAQSGPPNGVNALSALVMESSGKLFRNHIFSHYPGSPNFDGDICTCVGGTACGCINYYPSWDSGASGNPGAFLIYYPADNSIDIINADGTQIIQKIC